MFTIHKKNIAIVLAATAVLSLFSCKKFIDEEQVSTLNESFYKTDAGIEDLVLSAYVPLQWKFTGEEAYALHNFGTDEFRLGDQFNYSYYNTYDANLNSNETFVNDFWNNQYAGIRRCNSGIQYLSTFNTPTSTTLGTTAQKNTRIAELQALRGLYYLQLVQQLGAVPLITSVPTAAQTEFPRASVADVYNQIISDFRAAGPVLSWRNITQGGRATKAMAYHFLAKAYLTRGSAVSDVRGQKASDMDSAIIFADSVITFSGHALETDFANLFSASYPNGTIPKLGQDGTPPIGDKSKITANNASNEVIFAAQFSDNLALAGLNNTTHLYYVCQYDNGMPGMVRDFFNGRPYRRLRPTDYTIDIFDKVNDSRFFKTFNTVYYRNVVSPTGLATFTAANAPSPDLVGKVRVGLGDTAALFIVNPASNPILTSTIANMRYYSVFARNKRASVGAAIATDYTPGKYLSMMKFLDGVRLTTTNNETRGIRNGTLARLAETYLIEAEAYGRKGNYTQALVYINAIRKRGAYKSLEARSPQIWQYLGGPTTLDDTQNSNLATTTLFTTNATSEQYPTNITSTTDRFIAFMLNERTRELCGEFDRWEDLARTETLYDRAKLFNADVSSGLATFHKLRPIPLLQITLQTIGGQPMNASQIAQYQNPGY